MPFNKIAELGAELGKAQLILESKDREIENLKQENVRLMQQFEQQAGIKRDPGVEPR